MNHWTEKNIFQTDLTKLATAKLLGLYQEFIRKQALEYAYGVALLILDFQGFSLVENYLKDYLKKNASEENFQKYYAVFTAPSHNSFSQDQEEDLLKLMAKYWRNSGWRQAVRQRAWTVIRIKYPRFYQDLVRHSKKFAWVYYVYSGPAYTEKEFLGFIRDYLAKRINPKKELTRMNRNKKLMEAKKKNYLSLLKPDKKAKKMLLLAGKLVWGKPRRKDYQSRSYYHAEKLQREMARRLNLSLAQVRSAPFPWLAKALKGQGKIDVKSINEIYNFHICLPAGGKKTVIIYGKKAEIFARKYLKQAKTSHLSKKVNTLIGECACPDKACGRVKIVNSREEMGKVNYGDILVSVATSPNLMPAMKKASAFVTEEGGLTSHAAIVSREMNVPCVIGTKIATQVFKDGDLVEVDTTEGTVRKLS